MTPHLPCAAVDRAWRRGGSRRINCQANQCQSGLRVWIPPSLVKSIYSRVRTEPDNSARHVRRLCSSNIFLRYRAHSRRAPPKPVMSLVSYLISSVLQLSRKNSSEESAAFWSCKRTQFAQSIKAKRGINKSDRKIVILELIRTNNFCVLIMSFCELIYIKRLPI